MVNSAAADLAAAVSDPQSRIAPFADPGNPLAILVPFTAAAFDVIAVGAAVTGWVVRLPAAPKTTRAAAALLNNQPRIVGVLDHDWAGSAPTSRSPRRQQRPTG